MTQQEIDQHFKGYKWHHFLLYFPAGFLFWEGIAQHNIIETICSASILIGALLQGRFFVRGIRKMLDFILQDLNH
jgi:hypothetical protein